MTPREYKCHDQDQHNANFQHQWADTIEQTHLESKPVSWLLVPILSICHSRYMILMLLSRCYCRAEKGGQNFATFTPGSWCTEPSNGNTSDVSDWIYQRFHVDCLRCCCHCHSMECSGFTQSLPIIDYVDFYRKWLTAVHLQQSLVARDLARSRRVTPSAKTSIWSPAHDVERSNASLPSNYELPRCHADRIAVLGCHQHGMTSSPEAESVVGKLLSMSGDNLSLWNHLEAM